MKDFYGDGFSLHSETVLRGISPVPMDMFNHRKHCVLVSLSAVLLYYSEILKIPNNIDEIFQAICSYAKKHFYYFEFYGVNLLMIPKLARGVFRQFGYESFAKNHLILEGSNFAFETSKKELTQGRPFLISFWGGDYRNHTTVCYGYSDYVRGFETKRFLILSDGWVGEPRYVDCSMIGSLKTAFYAITSLFPVK